MRTADAVARRRLDLVAPAARAHRLHGTDPLRLRAGVRRLTCLDPPVLRELALRQAGEARAVHRRSEPGGNLPWRELAARATTSALILLVDNYDSFVWNIVQGFETLGAEVRVVRNDAVSVEEALDTRPLALVLGPGPGRPAQAGIVPELLVRAPDELPILGVCLGHQALVEACGGVIERDPAPAHGWSSPVHHDGDELFRGVPSPFEAGRYHSLRARREALPRELCITAWTQDGIVMAVRHVRLPRFGVQFHPDSILTPAGGRIFANFLALAGVSRRAPAASATPDLGAPRASAR